MTSKNYTPCSDGQRLLQPLRDDQEVLGQSFTVVMEFFKHAVTCRACELTFVEAYFMAEERESGRHEGSPECTFIRSYVLLCKTKRKLPRTHKTYLEAVEELLQHLLTCEKGCWLVLMQRFFEGEPFLKGEVYYD